ncbi:uncharacterized protein YegP (UPF0339 family), partial [Flavobacterium sp. CG_9.10]
MKISNTIEELGDCCHSSGHSNKKKNKKLGYFSIVLFLLMTSVQMVYAQVPTITSFSPTSAKGGATVTIIGTNFTGATSVKFGTEAAASFTVVNSTTITAVVSSSGESGRIFVTTAAGTAEIINFIFLPPPSCNIVGPLKACFGNNLTYQVEIANSGYNPSSTPLVPELLISFPPGPDNTTNGPMIVSNTPFAYDPVTNSGTLTAELFPGTTTGKILGVLTVNAPGGSCECSASIVITDVNITTTSPPIKCIGGTTTLQVNATSSGIRAYKYTLSRAGFPDIVKDFTPFTTVFFDNLVAGNYTVTVMGDSQSNGLGCTSTVPVVISDPPAIVVSSATGANPKCNGGTDGSLTITASGGTGTLMYSKDNGATYQASNVFSGLAAGTYLWAVKDANDCILKGTVTLTQPTILASSDAHVDVKCNGGKDGSVTLTYIGGTSPYMVNFNGAGFVTQTSPSAYTGLTAGTYTWIVKDANGCIVEGSETIAQPSILVATDAHADVKCNGGRDGSVTVTFSGGTSPYMVNFNGAGFVAQTSPNAYTGLTAGTYTWIVKDANGCIVEGSETIAQPSILVATDAHADVKCNGGRDGSVTVTFSGGTSPYMVNFNGAGFVAQTSPNAYTGLTAGTYTWIVKDANGCIVQGSETIAQPTILVATDAHADVKCNGGRDGSINVTFSGGTSPYMVNFNGAGFVTQTSPNAYTGLAAGTYTWIVKDANGCIMQGSETIAQPTILVATDGHSDVKCNGGTDGSVTVT